MTSYAWIIEGCMPRNEPRLTIDVYKHSILIINICKAGECVGNMIDILIIKISYEPCSGVSSLKLFVTQMPNDVTYVGTDYVLIVTALLHHSYKNLEFADVIMGNLHNCALLALNWEYKISVPA